MTDTPPKVYLQELVFEAFGVRVTASVRGLRLRVYVEIFDKTQYADGFITIKNQDGHSEMLQFLENLPEEERTRRGYRLPIPLKPGENNILVIISNRDGQTEKKKAVILGDGTVISRKGIQFQISQGELHDQIITDIDTLDVLANLTNFMNQLLEEKYKIRTISITSDTPRTHAALNGTKIELSSGLFSLDKVNLGTSIVHETAHAIYESKVRKMPGSVDFISNAIMFSSEAKQFQHILDIFDESTYMKNVPPEVGHPEDGASELFASALTVLKFFPHEFTKKTSMLENKDDRTLVRNTATFVVSSILQNPNCPKDFFDPKLLVFLEIKTGEKGKNKGLNYAAN